MRDVFSARKKSHERATLLLVVIAYCSTQHWILGFDCVENGFLRNRSFEVELHFVADARQRSQVMRQYDPDHGSVCASTDKTAGRSRTVAFHVSPALVDA